MTDAEIRKALECCGEHKRLCNECSYRYTLPERCDIDMLHDAVALINRQKAEIDILIRKKDTLRDEVESLREENKQIKEGIERLLQKLQQA
jgi:hypothetical protein